MPFARKLRIFGPHSLLLLCPKKISLGARIFFDRGAITPSFYLPQAAEEEISLAKYGKEVLLEVKNHRIAFISSDCPDKVCIHNGWLAREGEQAVCLPNRVSVILTDGSTVPVELS